MAGPRRESPSQRPAAGESRQGAGSSMQPPAARPQGSSLKRNAQTAGLPSMADYSVHKTSSLGGAPSAAKKLMFVEPATQADTTRREAKSLDVPNGAGHQAAPISAGMMQSKGASERQSPPQGPRQPSQGGGASLARLLNPLPTTGAQGARSVDGPSAARGGGLSSAGRENDVGRPPATGSDFAPRALPGASEQRPFGRPGALSFMVSGQQSSHTDLAAQSDTIARMPKKVGPGSRGKYRLLTDEDRRLMIAHKERTGDGHTKTGKLLGFAPHAVKRTWERHLATGKKTLASASDRGEGPSSSTSARYAPRQQMAQRQVVAWEKASPRVAKAFSDLTGVRDRLLAEYQEGIKSNDQKVLIGNFSKSTAISGIILSMQNYLQSAKTLRTAQEDSWPAKELKIAKEYYRAAEEALLKKRGEFFPAE